MMPMNDDLAPADDDDDDAPAVGGPGVGAP